MMGDSELIPTLKFDSALEGRKHRYDSWREMVRCVYDVEPIEDADSPPERLDGWLVDSLIFSEVAFSKQTFSHHSGHLQDSNYLSFQIYETGGAKGIAADEPWTMRPGQVHIFDFSREFHSVAHKSVVSGVTIPHEAIGYRPDMHPAHIVYSGHSAVGRFLMDSYHLIRRRLPELHQQEATALAQGFCGLLRGVLSPQAKPVETIAKRSASERRLAMRSYLDRNLSDPSLGIDHLLRTFGASRPSIYRSFADVGGVSNYINARRLDRAFHRLRSTGPSHGRIKEIANQFGYYDTAYFNRLFRQRFGTTPGNIMQSRHLSDIDPRRSDQNGPSNETSQLSDWFNCS